MSGTFFLFYNEKMFEKTNKITKFGHIGHLKYSP